MSTVTKLLLAQGTGVSFNLYEGKANTVAEVSSIMVCNRGVADTIRVSISLVGAATADKDYIYYDLALAAATTFAAALGIIVPASAIVRAYSTTGNSSFTLFGTEEYPV